LLDQQHSESRAGCQCQYFQYLGPNAELKSILQSPVQTSQPWSAEYCITRQWGFREKYGQQQSYPSAPDVGEQYEPTFWVDLGNGTQ